MIANRQLGVHSFEAGSLSKLQTLGGGPDAIGAARINRRESVNALGVNASSGSLKEICGSVATNGGRFWNKHAALMMPGRTLNFGGVGASDCCRSMTGACGRRDGFLARGHRTAVPSLLPAGVILITWAACIGT